MEKELENWFLSLSLKERISALAVEDRDEVRLIHNMYLEKRNKGNSFGGNFTGVFLEVGHSESLPQTLPPNKFKREVLRKQFLDRKTKDFLFRKEPTVGMVKVELEPDLKFERAIRFSDSKTYCDTITLSSELVENGDHFLSIMDKITDNSFLKHPSHVEWKEKLKRWEWTKPRWYEARVVYTLATYVAHRLAMTLWKNFWMFSGKDPRGPIAKEEKRRYSGKMKNRQKQLNLEVLHSKQIVTSFWESIGHSAREDILKGLQSMVEKARRSPEKKEGKLTKDQCNTLTSLISRVRSESPKLSPKKRQSKVRNGQAYSTSSPSSSRHRLFTPQTHRENFRSQNSKFSREGSKSSSSRSDKRNGSSLSADLLEARRLGLTSVSSFSLSGSSSISGLASPLNAERRKKIELKSIFGECDQVQSDNFIEYLFSTSMPRYNIAFDKLLRRMGVKIQAACANKIGKDLILAEEMERNMKREKRTRRQEKRRRQMQAKAAASKKAAEEEEQKAQKLRKEGNEKVSKEIANVLHKSQKKGKAPGASLSKIPTEIVDQDTEAKMKIVTGKKRKKKKKKKRIQQNKISPQHVLSDSEKDVSSGRIKRGQRTNKRSSRDDASIRRKTLPIKLIYPSTSDHDFKDIKQDIEKETIKDSKREDKTQKIQKTFSQNKAAKYENEQIVRMPPKPKRLENLPIEKVVLPQSIRTKGDLDTKISDEKLVDKKSRKHVRTQSHGKMLKLEKKKKKKKSVQRTADGATQPVNENSHSNFHMRSSGLLFSQDGLRPDIHPIYQVPVDFRMSDGAIPWTIADFAPTTFATISKEFIGRMMSNNDQRDGFGLVHNPKAAWKRKVKNQPSTYLDVQLSKGEYKGIPKSLHPKMARARKAPLERVRSDGDNIQNMDPDLPRLSLRRTATDAYTVARVRKDVASRTRCRSVEARKRYEEQKEEINEEVTHGQIEITSSQAQQPQSISTSNLHLNLMLPPNTPPNPQASTHGSSERNLHVQIPVVLPCWLALLCREEFLNPKHVGQKSKRDDEDSEKKTGVLETYIKRYEKTLISECKEKTPLSLLQYFTSRILETSLPLDIEIRHFDFYVTYVVNEARSIYEEIIVRVTKVVKGIWKSSCVQRFGSYATGLALPSSDIDLVVSNAGSQNEECKEGGFSSQYSHSFRSKFQRLADELRKHPWTKDVKAIHTAKVPVVKHICTVGGKSVPIDITFDFSAPSRKEAPSPPLLHKVNSFDASVEKSRTKDIHHDHGQAMLHRGEAFLRESTVHNGVRSVGLIKGYLKHLPSLRPLLLVLKQFLYERGLNNIFSGGLSSYCLILMIVSFLRSNPKPKADLGTLLMKFLRHYGYFNYSKMGINPEAKEEKDIFFEKEEETPFLTILDPLDTEKVNPLERRNIGAGVWNMLKIRSAFNFAMDLLREKWSTYCSTELYRVIQGLGVPLKVDNPLPFASSPQKQPFSNSHSPCQKREKNLEYSPVHTPESHKHINSKNEPDLEDLVLCSASSQSAPSSPSKRFAKRMIATANALTSPPVSALPFQFIPPFMQAASLHPNALQSMQYYMPGNLNTVHMDGYQYTDRRKAHAKKKNKMYIPNSQGSYEFPPMLGVANHHHRYRGGNWSNKEYPQNGRRHSYSNKNQLRSKQKYMLSTGDNSKLSSRRRSNSRDTYNKAYNETYQCRIYGGKVDWESKGSKVLTTIDKHKDSGNNRYQGRKPDIDEGERSGRRIRHVNIPRSVDTQQKGPQKSETPKVSSKLGKDEQRWRKSFRDVVRFKRNSSYSSSSTPASASRGKTRGQREDKTPKTQDSASIWKGFSRQKLNSVRKTAQEVPKR